MQLVGLWHGWMGRLSIQENCLIEIHRLAEKAKCLVTRVTHIHPPSGVHVPPLTLSQVDARSDTKA